MIEAILILVPDIRVTEATPIFLNNFPYKKLQVLNFASHLCPFDISESTKDHCIEYNARSPTELSKISKT